MAAVTGDPNLRRALGALHLTTLGIGAIVGAGIFVITGWAAARYAGPAVPLSFALAGIACALAGLCYAEMAAAVPVAGSAYTYARATMGELMGWIIGWDLVLEYGVSSATVGVGWSGYFTSLLAGQGLTLPQRFTSAPLEWCEVGVAGCSQSGLHATGAILNVPAVAVVLFATAVLVIGVRQSALVNNLLVALKLGILLLFIVFGALHVQADHWRPFIVPNAGEFGRFGWSGVLRGAGLIFFAFIGFDAVSTAAQEARNPQRDLPIGILVSLAVCTVLYMIVSAILTGLVPYTELDVTHPVGFAVEAVPALRWMAPFVDLGAVLGLGSVVLVMLLGQSRVFYAMSRDRLLPAWIGRIHPRLQTPYLAQIAVGVFAGALAGIFPLQVLGELVNIGTLLAFVLVCLGIVLLRRARPELPRPFRTPWVPVVPLLGAASCLGLMATLPLDTWLRLFVWMAVGLAIYFVYGRRRGATSRHERPRSPRVAAPTSPRGSLP